MAFDFDIKTLLLAAAPLVVTNITWVGLSIFEHEKQLAELDRKMHILVTPTGEIIPSPKMDIQKIELQKEIQESYHDLDIRLSILEEKE